MNKKIVLSIFLVLTSLSLWGEVLVRGRVYDENHNILPGASVYVQDNKRVAAVADKDGSFELRVAQASDFVVCVSFMGYETHEFPVSGNDVSLSKDVYMEPDRDLLEEVVVTGTRTPKLLKDAPIITRVISNDDIRKVDATNVADLLQAELPGIEFSYAMNQQVQLNMSGFGGNAVLFLVDGERVAGETLDNIDYNRLNLENVERIEIVKGASSSLYGSNAVGGVVNLISKTATEPWSVNLNARYGAFNDIRYGASVGFKVRKVSNTLTFQGHQTDDVPLAKDKDSGIEKIYANQSYNLKDRLVWTPSRKLKFIANAGYFYRQREASLEKDERYRGVDFGLKGIWNITDKDMLDASYSFDEYDKSDFEKSSRLDIRDYCNVQQRVRMMYSHTFRGKHTLTAGTDYMNDYLMSYQFDSQAAYIQHTADLFAQFDWNPLKSFNMIAGLRYDYFSAADRHSVSPKLSLMYKVGNCSLRASYASGFRAPTLKEMYMNFNMANVFMIYGNKDLRPETSHNLSLSAEYTHRYWNVTATGFYNFVNDRITTVWNKEKNGMVYTNTAPLSIAGVDASVSMKLDCGLGARVSYVFTKEMIEKGHPILSSTRPHTLTAKIDYGYDWKHYGFNIALSGRFLSRVSVDEYTSANNYEETERVDYPGYTIWKLNLTQRVWRGIRIIAVVDNLFNYRPDYYYNNSPTTTGTTASVGLSLDIEELFRK